MMTSTLYCLASLLHPTNLAIHSRRTPIPTASATATACTDLFGSVEVPAELSSRLLKCGFHKPMPIQSAAMPRIAAGENIVLHSATGSGKTLAFLVPLLASIKPEDGLRVVVAAPSQELAVQIATEAERLLSAEDDAPSPHSRVLLAISSSRETELEQHDKLFASSKPPQVMVGTPQRLADLCRKERARPVLRNVRSVVLDEVDRMLPPVPQEKQQAAQQRGRGAPDFRGRGARGRGGGRGGRGGRGPGRGITVAEVNSIERRLTRTRPAEVLLQRIERARPRSAPPLQLISSSATISPDLLRTIGAALGGVGKKSAGTVVTAGPAHPSPKSLKRFGVAGVQMPSTIRHSAYVGKPPALNQMFKLAMEELSPTAPLLVIPNGQSVQRRVQSLRAIGLGGAIALQDALGVPSAGEGNEDDDGEEPRGRVRAARGDSLQSSMFNSRTELADAFAAPRKKGGGGGQTAVSGIQTPLLVTTEHSARGIDFKGIDCVFLIGLPKRVESYIHVAGRTAREGRKGRAVCLLTEPGEVERLSDFGRELGINVEKVDVRFLTGRS